MTTSILTSKGQTTIPKNIRDFLKIKTGDRLDFIVNHDGNVLVRPTTINVMSLKGLLSSKTKKKATLQEIKDAIRKRAAQKIS